MFTCLCGGVGASRFLQGLVRVVPPEDVVAIVNTGDDLELYGLYICPDIDTIVYTLAGLVDEEKGWGIKGDTYRCLEMLNKYGFDTWFLLGDMDLATHLYRTFLLKAGLKLDEVTRLLCNKLGVKSKIIPMTNDRVRTKLLTNEGILDFQEYFVKRRCEPKVQFVIFEGIEDAKPSPGVIESILSADLIIICPSNPILSIQPILSIKGVEEALKKTKAKVIGISPIIRGATVKGPADKIMKELGMEASAYGVAKFYRNILDTFIIDEADSFLADRIEKDLSIKTVATNILMKSMEDKVRLAKLVINEASS